MILWFLVRVEFTQQFFPLVGMAVVTALHPVFTEILEMLNKPEVPVSAAIYGWY